MDYLVITDDKKEQERIGRKIVCEKPSVYSPKMLNYLKKTIDAKLKNEAVKTRENEVYRSIYHYWAFGCSVDEYLAYGFFVKSAEQIREYVSAHEKVLYLSRLNKKENAHLLNNKYEAYLLLKDYYKRDVIKIATEDDFETFLRFVEKHPEFVVKPADMAFGDGVHKASVNNLDRKGKRQFFEQLLNEAKENVDQYWFGSEKALVLEELIEQDEHFAAFHPESVNSVRITTIRIGEQIHVYHPWIKIGRGGQFVTSAVYGTFDAGIDEKNGVVVTPAYNEDFEVYDVHPDTRIPIKGFQVPRWDEAIQLAKELATKTPGIAYTGWDLVLTSNGWCVMEGNYHGDFMWQLFYEKGCKKEFEDLIGWKIDKEFWWK